MKPNFFIIGAPKSGTTALYNHLCRHPSVGMSDPKEPHFFDYNYSKGVSHYLKRSFRFCDESQLAVGEATPHYLFVPYAAERIARHFPNAKLIAILRNPIERAYADWWMYFSRARDRMSFDEAIQQNLNRLKNGPFFWGPNAERMWHEYYAQTCGGIISQRPYIEMGYYNQQIKRYLDFFPRKQIKVLFFDDFKTRPEKILKEVHLFLGLRSEGLHSPAETIEKNEAIGFLAKPLFQIARRTRTEKFIHALPRPLKLKVKSWSRIKKRPKISEATCQKLIKHYQPFISELEDLTNRNLDKWMHVNN